MLDFRKIITYLSKLNVYVETNDDTPDVRESRIRSTRLYFLLLILSICIITFYTALSQQTVTVVIDNPLENDYEYLEDIYPNTISCACSRTIISYDTFVTIKATFHQICSSYFIRSTWLDYVTTANSSMKLYPLDIRSSISSQFQLLQSFCQHAQEVVSNGLMLFMGSKFITPTLLSRSTFDAQVDLLVTNSLMNLLAEQQRTIALISAINEQNQLPSALETNFIYLASEYNHNGLYFVQYPSMTNTSSYCSCQSSFDCVYTAGIYYNLTSMDALNETGYLQAKHTPDYTIPGMLVGCFPSNVLLKSTLECLFNSTCLSILQSKLFHDSSFTGPTLNITSQTRFSLNATIQMLSDEMFIEQWISTKNYSAFYEQCHPSQCVYSYVPKINTAFVISTILSLFGGLSIAIKLISPLIIDIYQKILIKIKRNDDNSNENTVITSLSIRQYILSLVKTTQVKFIQLNLFKKPVNNTYGRRTEILSTRVYIMLMFTGVAILSFYTLIGEHIETIHIEKPSISTYRQLANKQQGTVSCPCTQIATPYESFFSIMPIYHEVCSSVFVTKNVFPTFPLNTVPFQLGIFDFNFFGPSFFNLLPKLCTLSQKTINDAILTFNATKYISTTLTAELEFLARANASLTNFRTQVLSDFRHALRLNLNNTQGNWLLTASFTNAFMRQLKTFLTDDGPNSLGIYWINPLDPSCNCGTSTTNCLISFARYCQSSIFQGVLNCYALSNQTVNGLTVGCSPMEGVLHSSLECLYDNACLQMILFAIQYYSVTLGNSFQSTTIAPLNETVLKQFKHNTPIIEIIEGLMIDDWNLNISFESYFSQCQPSICLHTFTQRFNILNMIITTAGLVGGLSVALRILVPLVMKLIRRKKFQQVFSIASTVVDGGLNETILRRAKRWISQLNWFENARSTGDESARRKQILSTRLYIILFCLSFFGLLLLTTVPQQSTTLIVTNPSLTDFENLTKQERTFLCSCSNLNIQYSSFMTFAQPILHQVCSSSFVSETWISIVLGETTVNRSIAQGFLSAHFRLLGAFCQSSKEILEDTQHNFLSTNLITITPLSRNEFTEQMNLTINEFYSQSSRTFRRMLAFILQMTLANQVMSSYESNWYVSLGLYPSVDIIPRYYGNCSCGSYNVSNCVAPLQLNKNNVTIDGMLVGCLPLTSLLQSSLLCFYQQDCLHRIHQTLNLDLIAPNLILTTLDNTTESRFKPDSTLDNIINSLFVETWTSQANYSSYFHECAVKTCTYSRFQNDNVLVFITKFISFYGGMTVVLRFLARLLINISRMISKRITSIRWRREVE